MKVNIDLLSGKLTMNDVVKYLNPDDLEDFEFSEKNTTLSYYEF